MKALIILLGITLLFSCSDITQPEQLEKTQSLSSDLEQVSTTSNNLEINDIELKINEILKVESRIKNNFQDDTLDFLLIEQLDKYKRIRPSFTFVLNGKRTIDSTLEERISALNNLKSDIENSVGNRAKYDEYIENEKIQIDDLSDFVKNCDSTLKQSLETFDNLHSKIEKFSFELEMKNTE